MQNTTKAWRSGSYEIRSKGEGEKKYIVRWRAKKLKTIDKDRPKKKGGGSGKMKIREIRQRHGWKQTCSFLIILNSSLTKSKFTIPPFKSTCTLMDETTLGVVKCSEKHPRISLIDGSPIFTQYQFLGTNSMVWLSSMFNHCIVESGRTLHHGALERVFHLACSTRF